MIQFLTFFLLECVQLSEICNINPKTVHTCYIAFYYIHFKDLTSPLYLFHNTGYSSMMK